MATDVKVIINLITPIGNVGFGCPLILVENAETEIAYATYKELDAIATAGFATTSDAYKTAQLMFSQPHSPSKIAICATTTDAETWLAVESNVSKDWRQLVVLNAGETATDVAGIMALIEAQEKYPKFYYANLDYDDSTALTVTDIDRTLLCYYTPTEDVPCPVAAIAGEIGGLVVGSYTINNLVVDGIVPLELSQTEIDAVHEKGGVTFVLSAGDCVVSEGHSAGGGYVDNVDGNDYIKQQLIYKTQKVFNNNLKVPYTNAGIALLEAAAIDVMTDALNKGITESFEVKYALREEVDPMDRFNRKYFGGKVKYSMAGAIHEIEIVCDCVL